MTRFRWISAAIATMALCAAAAASVPMAKRHRMVLLPLEGEIPAKLSGSWYNMEDGRLDLRVYADAINGSAVAIRSDLGAVSASATEAALSMALGEPSNATMTLKFAELHEPEGSSTATLWMHNYWLLREPSLMWRLSVRFQKTVLEPSWQKAVDVLDWTVEHL